MIDSTSDNRTINNVMRHQYRVLTDDEKATMLKIKDMGLEFVTYLEANVVPGRERALAITKMEEAVMWAVKQIT